MKLSKSLSKKLITIGAAFTFMFLWVFLIKSGLKYTRIFNPFVGFVYTPLGIFFFSCIIAPLWEELVFRHAPLQITKKLNQVLNVDFTWPVIFISSAIFGWGHGQQAVSILIQGVMGVVFSIVYIRNNYSYWSSTVLHFLWNSSVYYIFPNFVTEYGIKIW